MGIIKKAFDKVKYAYDFVKGTYYYFNNRREFINSFSVMPKDKFISELNEYFSDMALDVNVRWSRTLESKSATYLLGVDGAIINVNEDIYDNEENYYKRFLFFKELYNTVAIVDISRKYYSRNESGITAEMLLEYNELNKQINELDLEDFENMLCDILLQLNIFNLDHVDLNKISIKDLICFFNYHHLKVFSIERRIFDFNHKYTVYTEDKKRKSKIYRKNHYKKFCKESLGYYDSIILDFGNSGSIEIIGDDDVAISNDFIKKITNNFANCENMTAFCEDFQQFFDVMKKEQNKKSKIISKNEMLQICFPKRRKGEKNKVFEVSDAECCTDVKVVYDDDEPDKQAENDNEK